MVTLPITVLAFETDFGGVVYNTRYLEYLERGRYELFHAKGFTISGIWEEHGVQFVVRRAEVDYLGFARHEDKLELKTWVAAHAGATTIVHHELKRVTDGAVVLRAKQTLAYLNTKWRPVRVPQIFKDVLPVDEITE
jgi:acyl-CoA thioester hydrolase